jgi:NADPH:quinone reductase-like Zn-dependent oxidoreductase
MRAVVRYEYGSPDIVEVIDTEVPVPGDDEILVRVEASSINTADLDVLRGVPRATRMAMGWSRPRSPALGIDVAGEVVDVGRGVKRFQPGDEVWGDMFDGGLGAFADYVSAPERSFTPKPPDLSFEQAATIPHSGLLALQALQARGLPQPGQQVLINGAGGCVGPFAIQIAKTHGGEVTGVDHTDKLDFMRSVGADHVIDYTQEDYTNGGRRYDLIVDIAVNRSILAIRRVLEPGGAYTQIGRNLSGFLSAAVLGGLASVSSEKRMGVFNWVAGKEEDLLFCADLIREGRVTPVVDRTYRLGDVPEALRFQAAGRARGKLLIVP